MAPLSSTAFVVNDGEITVDGEALAPKLGLSIEALQENMTRGLVMSVTETGEHEDAGRTRLTFRYRARAWRVVIEADGSWTEDPLPVARSRPANDPVSRFGPANGM